MKRFLSLIAALALLSAAVLTAAGLTLGGAGDDVTVTEELLYGVPAAVADITLTARTQYDRRLFWTTSYPLGRPEEGETEFVCRPEGVPQEYEWGRELQIQAGGYGSASGGGLEMEDLPTSYPIRAIAAVAERTAAGETREETINLGDYYDIYPLSIYHDYTRSWEDEKVNDMAFTDYLALPVPQEQRVNISLTKAPSGDLIRVECGSDSTSFDLQTCSVTAGDAVYFALYLTSPDGAVDLLPDRLRGIHRIDFTANEHDIRTLVPDSLRRVFPLDAAAGKARQLTESADGKRLLLVTETQAGATLSVVEKNGMKLLQTLPLSFGSDTRLECLSQEDGFLIAIRSDGTFDLLTEGADGALSIRFSGSFFEHTDLEWLSFTDLSLQYDGRRLVAGFFGYRPQGLDWESSYYESCAATVMVFDPTGLLYAGRYHSSADRAYGETSDGHGTSSVTPDGNGSKGLSFQSS